MKSRWNGIRGASVAVAGVCLSSSLASASTTARAANFETEFEPGDAALAAKPAQSALASAAAPAGDFWEQTLVGYLDKLVAKECEKCDGVADKAAVVANEAGESSEIGKTIGALAGKESKASASVEPDWDLADPTVPLAAVNPDWDLEEPLVVANATSKIDPDWDLEEPAVVFVAAINPDWDLQEPAIVAAKPFHADWDLEEPAATGDAQAAAASEPAPAAPIRDPNPDWDLDEPVVASTSPEVTRTDDAGADFDLFP